jgi:hypothetical protein
MMSTLTNLPSSFNTITFLDWEVLTPDDRTRSESVRQSTLPTLGGIGITLIFV